MTDLKKTARILAFNKQSFCSVRIDQQIDEMDKYVHSKEILYVTMVLLCLPHYFSSMLSLNLGNEGSTKTIVHINFFGYVNLC